jgi:uncharacterized protein (TIGR00369 family)
LSHLDYLRDMVAGRVEFAEVAKLIGMRIVSADEGRVTFELDAGPEHSSPPGTLHGGILCDLADAAMGCANLSLLPDDKTFATVELKINFLKPVWTGRVTAVGEVIKAGRTLSLCECRITDESGSLVAFATSTCMTLARE